MNKDTKPPIIKRSRLFSGLLVAMGGVANAATIEVDDSTCKLVDAIEAANTDIAVNGCTAGNGDDVIRLVKNPSGTGLKPTHRITAQHVASAYVGGYVGTPIINTHITIEGEGQQITANPDPDPFRVFEVVPSGTLILNNVTVNGGNDGFGLGSGVLNYAGNLEINQSTLYGHNGAVASIYGYTTINQTNLVSNFNDGYSYSTAAFIYGSIFNLSNSSVINNKLADFPPLLGDKPNTIKRLKGVPGIPPATLSLMNSESTLTNSTISGNGHLIGGLAAGEYTLPPSIMKRLKKNAPKRHKGGPNVGTTLSHLTVSNNKGQAGGLFFSPGHQVTLEGNIITGNTSIINTEYANGYIADATYVTTDAHNFVGENGQSGFMGLTLGTSDVVFSNAAEDNLYPLNRSNNTFIHPLKHGSAAIDGLTKSCYQGLFIDQEGKGRGIDGDSNGSFVCDAGAFEHSLPIDVSGPCTLHNALISANNDGSIGGCQPGNGHDIINIPESTTVTGTEIVDSYSIFGYTFGSGLPVIRSGVVINGNHSTIERDISSPENFNMLSVADENGLILNDTIVSGANDGLAAVSAWYGSEVQLFNATISNNEVTGVSSLVNHNSGVHYSNINNNDNSSSFFYSLSSGVLGLISHNFQLKNNLIANNVANYGLGATQLTGNQNMVVSNNTISGNSGAQIGGLVLQQNTALITHNTITDNSGAITGGVYIADSINSRFSHNIISGNEITSPPPLSPNTSSLNQLPLFGAINPVTPSGVATYAEMIAGGGSNLTTGNNVLGQNGSSGTSGFTLDASDIVPVGATSTVISPTLADNGGPTMTHLPAPGSVAIDAGSNDCELNVRDQRGYIRPWDGDGDNNDVCDIGAVEANSVAIADLIFKDGFDATIMLK